MTFGKKFWSLFWKSFVLLLIISFGGELIGHPFRQTSSEAIVPGWITWSFDYAFWIAFVFSAIEASFKFATDLMQALADEVVERVIEGVMDRIDQRDRARAELRDI